MRHWPKWAAAAGTGGDEEGIRRKRVWALGAETAGDSEGAQRKLWRLGWGRRASGRAPFVVGHQVGSTE